MKKRESIIGNVRSSWRCRRRGRALWCKHFCYFNSGIRIPVWHALREYHWISVLGIFIEVSALAWSPSHEIRTFIVVGVLGSFTTFSMFSLDVVSLMTRGETVPALIYMASSVLLSIGAIWLGLMVTRVLIS